jgi:hypothetical protein
MHNDNDKMPNTNVMFLLEYVRNRPISEIRNKIDELKHAQNNCPDRTLMRQLDDYVFFLERLVEHKEYQARNKRQEHEDNS